MTQSTASRRLVKSPPELWAEVSSEEALSRHLVGFGEIRITSIEPETTVAWEGDRISGTVELAPTGWGTKVVLTATPAALLAADPGSDQPSEPAPVTRAPSPATQPPPVIAIRPAEPVDDAPGVPIAGRPRRGLFARLFGRRTHPVAAAAVPGPAETAPEPTPRPPSPPATPAPNPERAMTILSEVLDELGAAHHRPFSRD